MITALRDALCQHLSKIEGTTWEQQQEDVIRMALIHHDRKLRSIAETEPELARLLDDRSDEEKSVRDPDLPPNQ